MRYLSIIALAAILSSSAMPAIYHPAPYEKEYTSLRHGRPWYDCPGSLLQAIALVESGERDDAIGPDGLDHGRFQLRALYHAERAAKWGNFDPFDPVQAARIAALILEESYRALGSWPLAISAYNRGIAGTKKRGIASNYLKKVRLSLDAMRRML